MDGITRVREFNRTVTERIGALDDHYLARGRPLGQSRLLWEIGAAGPEGAELRDLRERLGLDSGYLSRQLRALEADGLVRVEPAADDSRVRVVRLTELGRAERAELDRGSDDLARGILDPLTDRQRTRLLDAMDEVRRLMTASAVEVRVVDPAEPAARASIDAYFAELATRFDVGFDPGQSRLTSDDEFREPQGAFLVAFLHGTVVGCVGVKRRDGDEYAEIKRLWVSPDARGIGLGARLLREAEAAARRLGAASARLDTNRTLTEAIALYRANGYVEIDDFNGERYADFWFEKPLD
ncbi:bifunctional helix-turn-helix transcriptional regulator/GNAT family N-acetyltransferase [Agromyces sp. C10]|uniref:bifunctional helix-turn-helix transcriptional regulator/GNAT family N-acetyltransferase n=1 Tax=Agromyces sp. C10 TaxID=2935077 RepID=UPI00200B057E|nr:bifunctional helix-turn-helix transcriptional regulator/GNAT family N-acetyltransferase [Agromyces sp. C10]MCK8609295.1 bifunctional helix-turn-helix transcriptional regulator/GNAT family N-acetyltransferase [Agromyces sp. C10]